MVMLRGVVVEMALQQLADEGVRRGGREGRQVCTPDCLPAVLCGLTHSLGRATPLSSLFCVFVPLLCAMCLCVRVSSFKKIRILRLREESSIRTQRALH